MQDHGRSSTLRLRPAWVAVLCAASMLLIVAPSALAAQTTIGPPSVDTDTTSFGHDYDRDAATVTIDDVNLAQTPGMLTDVRYFPGPSGGGGSLAFLAVNPTAGTYAWVGPQIYDDADATAPSGAPTYTSGTVGTYTPAQTVAIPQGDALGVYMSSTGIIPFKFGTGTDQIRQVLSPAQPPDTESSFTRPSSDTRNYSFQGDFDPATQLVVTPAPGNPGTAPAGSQDQLPHLVSFQDAAGTTVPDSLDAQNITLTSAGGTVTDCHGHSTTHPTASGTTGVYSFCLQVDQTVGTDTITASDPGAPSVTNASATVTQTTPQPSQISVTVSPGSVTADGASQATVTAHLTDPSGDDFSGDAVTFSSSPAGGPTISPSSATVGSGNVATTTLTASKTLGTYTITARDTASGVTGSGQLVQTAVPAPSAPQGGGTPTPPPTPGSKPAPAPQIKAKPVTLTYKYRTAQHKTVTGHAKLTSCRATFTGKGKKRHQTGTSCRLTLTMLGLKAPHGSHARLNHSGATVGTGTARGSAVSLAISRPSLKGGNYTLLVHERRKTKRTVLQVHID
jgi:hypothetical protein